MYKINKPNARVPFQRRCSNWILSSQDPKYLPSGHLHNLLLWGLFDLSNSFLNNISYSTFLTLSQSVLVRLEVSFILLPGAFMRLNKHLSFCVLKIVEAWHALQPCKVYIYVCVCVIPIHFICSQPNSCHGFFVVSAHSKCSEVLHNGTLWAEDRVLGLLAVGSRSCGNGVESMTT